MICGRIDYDDDVGDADDDGDLYYMEYWIDISLKWNEPVLDFTLITPSGEFDLMKLECMWKIFETLSHPFSPAK